jgi:DNA-binding CsgD family transcriptional regulator
VRITDRPRRPGDSLLLENLTDQEAADLSGAIAGARRLLDPGAMPPLSQINDFETASKALAAASSAITSAVDGDRATGKLLASATDMNQLLSQLGHAETAIHAAQARHRERAVRMASDALARVQQITSVSQLINAGADAVCELGFDRAIISRVHESTWLVEKIAVVGDSEWANEILAAAQEHPQVLAPGLPEHDLIRKRRPVLVTNVQERKNVHEAVAEASQSRSYVAALLQPRSSVIGFLHADRFFHRGDVTEFDRELLTLFAQGFGFALERAILMQELDQIRDGVLGLGNRLSGVLNTDSSWPSAGSHPTAALGPAIVAEITEDPRDSDSRLTRREYEVLRLMASGDTNVRIAHKLVISEGTVKSHVKNILRKLQAANRAEAVARWHNGQPKR